MSNPRSTSSHQPSLLPPPSNLSMSLTWAAALASPCSLCLCCCPWQLITHTRHHHPTSSHSLHYKTCSRSRSFAQNSFCTFPSYLKKSKHFTRPLPTFPPFTLSLAHPRSDFLLIPKHPKFIQSSRSLQWLFPLPGTFFPLSWYVSLFTWLKSCSNVSSSGRLCLKKLLTLHLSFSVPLPSFIFFVVLWVSEIMIYSLTFILSFPI